MSMMSLCESEFKEALARELVSLTMSLLALPVAWFSRIYFISCGLAASR